MASVSSPLASGLDLERLLDLESWLREPLEADLFLGESERSRPLLLYFFDFSRGDLLSEYLRVAFFFRVGDLDLDLDLERETLCLSFFLPLECDFDFFLETLLESDLDLPLPPLSPPLRLGQLIFLWPFSSQMKHLPSAPLAGGLSPLPLGDSRHSLAKWPSLLQL